jgi:uncharacterized membrane protein YidH (DUF202 family)
MSGPFDIQYKTYYLIAFLVFISIAGILGGALVSIDAWNACDKKIDERSEQRKGVAISAGVFALIAIIMLVVLFMMHEDKKI